MANEIVTTVDPAKKAKSCEGKAIEQRNTRVDPMNSDRIGQEVVLNLCERKRERDSYRRATQHIKRNRISGRRVCLTDEARKNQR